MTYCDVVVLTVPTREVPSFSYSVPSRWRDSLRVGHLVRVPFGSRQCYGVVLSLTTDVPPMATRDLTAVMDEQPVLLPWQIELARWISANYLCPLSDACAAMLPSGILGRAVVRYRLGQRAAAWEPGTATPEVDAVVQALRSADEMDVRHLLDESHTTQAALRRMERAGWIARQTSLEEPSGPKTAKTYVLTGEGRRAAAEGTLERRAPRRHALLSLLSERGGALTATEVREVQSGASATLRALVDRGYVEVQSAEVRRSPLSATDFGPMQALELTAEQQGAWKALAQTIAGEGRRVALLHGVTGSGKTELYVRALREVVAAGRQGVLLVPEIGLTPQTVHRLGAYFGDRLALLHSKLSPGERRDEWRRIRTGQVDVVVGSRSALFAPLANLGLVVIDEEHDSSYKQDQSPRYHARDAAIAAAGFADAAVILGSATPDLRTYYRCQRGEYRLVRLGSRVSPEAPASGGPAEGAPMPLVHIVDMRRELQTGNKSIFSHLLLDALTRSLAAGDQAILFLNRRGSASAVVCRHCGYAVQCKRCDVAMTYHATEAMLVCHYCGWRSPRPLRCPRCHDPRIRQFGAGTERVESEARALFPLARVLRWDRDTTTDKDAHRRIWRALHEHEVDILVGTQMVAKGLDLPRVRLVGVMSADTALHLPELRAAERTFQMLTQVAGRAGRRGTRGEVIIQTYNPEHYSLQAAARHDFGAFYQQEIAFRRQHRYPPFVQLARLTFTGSSAEGCHEAATRMHRQLAHRLAQSSPRRCELVGPAPAFFEKIRGKHRWQILVKGEDVRSLLRGISLPLGWAIDVEPESVL